MTNAQLVAKGWNCVNVLLDQSLTSYPEQKRVDLLDEPSALQEDWRWATLREHSLRPA